MILFWVSLTPLSHPCILFTFLELVLDSTGKGESTVGIHESISVGNHSQNESLEEKKKSKSGQSWALPCYAEYLDFLHFDTHTWIFNQVLSFRGVLVLEENWKCWHFVFAFYGRMFSFPSFGIMTETWKYLHFCKIISYMKWDNNWFTVFYLKEYKKVS